MEPLWAPHPSWVALCLPLVVKRPPCVGPRWGAPWKTVGAGGRVSARRSGCLLGHHPNAQVSPQGPWGPRRPVSELQLLHQAGFLHGPGLADGSGQPASPVGHRWEQRASRRLLHHHCWARHTHRPRKTQGGALAQGYPAEQQSCSRTRPAPGSSPPSQSHLKSPEPPARTCKGSRTQREPHGAHCTQPGPPSSVPTVPTG